MRIYAAYLDPASLEEDRAAILVKEGMCWPAFFFSFLWAVWHRMWWIALALLAAAGIPAVLTALGANGAAGVIFAVAVAAFVGGAANDWRARALERRGRRLVAVVAGRNREDAARRLFEREPAEISLRPFAASERPLA